MPRCLFTPLGYGKETSRRRDPKPVEWVALLWLVVGAISAPVELHAQASLFPTLALDSTDLSHIYSTEAATEYLLGESAAEQGKGPAEATVDPGHLRRPTRHARRGARSLVHPYSNSHNLEWISKYRRGGVRSFHPYHHGALQGTVPSYQTYARQTHHGRIQTFGFGFGSHRTYTTPAGFGHGGFQAAYARSAHNSFLDLSREPNFQLGPLSANFTAYGSSEWIDRLPTTVDGSGSEDEQFIVSAGIDTAARLQISERSTLDFQIGVGFDYYAEDGRGGDEFDFQVLPNTRATYVFEVGPAEITLYDRFARLSNRASSYYSLDPLDYADYQEHALGATARVPLNDRVSVDAGYEFDQLDSLDPDGFLLDRASHSAFGGVTYSPDGAWEIGAQASASSIDYDAVERPDGTTASAGVFSSLPLTDYTRLSATAGFHQFEFDRVDEFEDSRSLESTYWSFSVENDLNDRVTHGLGLGSGASIGTSSNYVETGYASYTAQWRVFDDTVITAGASVARSAESGGLLQEEIDSVAYHVGVRHQLTDHTSLGVNLSQDNSASDIAERDYDQQRLQLFCAVELNDKLELRASYQRWEVDAQGDANSFTQNSATIGFTFHF